MPAKRVPMRQIRELLRLKHACGMSNRQIGDALGMGRTTVGDYLQYQSGSLDTVKIPLWLSWPICSKQGNRVCQYQPAGERLCRRSTVQSKNQIKRSELAGH